MISGDDKPLSSSDDDLKKEISELSKPQSEETCEPAAKRARLEVLVVVPEEHALPISVIALSSPVPKKVQLYDITAAKTRLRDMTKWWSNELAQALVAPTVWLKKNRPAPYIVFPQADQVFKALELCPDPADVKVIIVALDPYFNPGEACGIAFAVPKNHHLKKLPGSLVHILQEAKSKDFSLQSWAAQNVLLLNTYLTVDEHKSMSHANKTIGWANVTSIMLKDAILAATIKQKHPPIVLGWGAVAYDQLAALKKQLNVDFPLLGATHPSARSNNNRKARLPAFTGCGHFEECNKILLSRGQTQIKW